MDNFYFYNPTKILFGKGQEEFISNNIKLYGKKILLHYGQSSIKQNGIYDKITSNLKNNNIDFIKFGGVQQNPVLSRVREGIKISKEENIDFILAVGGGSVIDSAKAIAVGVKNEYDIWDYYSDGSKKINEALPVGVVLTIAGSGAESSLVGVLTNEEIKLKRTIRNPAIFPTFAILNPEFTYTLSPYQTACGASDILSHLFERYFTKTENVDLSDRLIESAILNILKFGQIACNEPTNYEARAEIMWCGYMAHNNILCRGRESDWACHAMEHALSGLYNSVHGAGLSILTLAWMKYVYNENIDKFVQLADRVFNIKPCTGDKEKIISDMFELLKNWYKSLNLPVSLKELDINNNNFEVMAKNALEKQEYIGKFKKLNFNDICEIYKLALD